MSKNCEICGKRLNARKQKPYVCKICRQAAEEKATAKNWMPKTQPGKPCGTCRYWRSLAAHQKTNYACHYLLDNGHGRPMDDAEVCLAWEAKKEENI